MEPHRTWIAIEIGTEARPELVRWATFYPRNPEKTQGSVRRLLHEEFDLVCPAHGRPYGGRDGPGAKAALARTLE